jgi:type-F conjugative transfer system pilin assembly protein TrbC
MSQGNILKFVELKENSNCKVTLQNLQEESFQKLEELRINKEFQAIVAELQGNGEITKPLFSSELGKSLEASLYIFVSFSMGEKALLNLAHEAKRFGATLVLRGFIDGSYLKTTKALQKIITKTGKGAFIDPELYTLFNVTAVPTIVLAKPFQLYAQERIQTPVSDKLQGHVSVRYALEQFVKEGDLKEEAQYLLYMRHPQ